MNGRRVHAVLAAGVANPNLVSHWRREPQLLRRQGLYPRSINLEGLWGFAGLTVKIRHNGLRADLPMTFRLLNVAGLEIEVFASYAAERASAGQQYAATAEARARDLVDFMNRWLDLERPEHSLLWDVVRHERALTQLGTSPPHPEAPDRVRATLTSQSVPRVRGHIVLHEMRCDPRAVVAALRESSPRLPLKPPGTVYFCYWRVGAAPEVRIVELDAFGFYALSFVDGVRTVSALNRVLGGGRRPTRAFLHLLDRLGVTGILAFERSR